MKINIGSGSERIDGYINVDRVRMPGVDIVHDLSKMPWPFKDASIDAIEASDIIEHLPDTIAVMDEIWRVLKPGGEVRIKVPDITQSLHIACTDPTHVRYFTPQSFDYFDPDTFHGTRYGYYTRRKFSIDGKYCEGGNLIMRMAKRENQ